MNPNPAQNSTTLRGNGLKIAALAGLAMLVASCAGAGAPAAGSGETTDLPTTTAPTDGGTTSDDSTEWVSPLTEFLSVGVAERRPESEAQARRDREKYGDLIAQCMADQGFTYVPYSSGGGSSVDEGTGGPSSLSPDEFVASYGFGITTVDTSEAPAEDPNENRTEAMSTAERTAYHEALWGDMVPLDEDGYPDRTGEVEPPEEPTDRGCTGAASDQVWGGTSDEADDVFTEFQPLIDDLQQLWSRVEADPRVEDAAGAWSDCMAEAGYPGFEGPDDPEQEVSQRLDGLIADADVSLDDESAAMGRRQINALEEVDPAALEELRGYELAVAQADHDCSVDYERVRRAVQTEIEQEFVDQHRDRLEDYRDALASRDGVG